MVHPLPPCSKILVLMGINGNARKIVSPLELQAKYS